MGKRKKTHHKKLLPVLCLILVIGYVVWCAVQPAMSLQPTYSPGVTKTSPAQKIALSWPAYGESALGAAGYGILGTSGAQTPVPTASIAKIVTVLAVLQQRPLHLDDQGPTITINQADIDSYNKYVAEDGSVVKVSLGEQITEYQAIQALLLPSANNMAETLARWAFGSIDAYNTYANNYVQGLGLKSVKITDPSGFLPTTVASAQDLTSLGELAMQNPIIAQIAAQPNATIPVEGTISNYNFLLGSDNNVGLKTGNSDQDPGAYLFAFKLPVGQSSVLVVGTIMNGPSLTKVLTDARTLYQSAKAQFQAKTFVPAGTVIATYHPKGRPAISAVTTQALTLVTWSGYAFTTTASLQTLNGTHASGTTVGTVKVTNLTTHAVNTVPVVLEQTVTAPSFVSRLLHP